MARFLIVDDEKDVILFFEQFLKMKGHKTVAKAFDGNQAVEMYEKFQDQIDIILMDQRMPKKSGMEASREILQMNPDMNIIFISADASIESQALNIGAKAFLEKPVKLTTLLEEIEKIVKKN